MTTILLTGKNGQVGWELRRTLAPLGKVVAVDAQELDLADPAAIREAVRSVRPDIIVNPAAYTAVDKAESEHGLAQAVNGEAPGVFAEEARALGAWMVHYSTDYVFDGEKRGAYLETDAPNPQSVYGKTKLAGEHAVRAAGGKHLIFRTSWVYGSRGHNFMLTMLRLARERKELRVVNDQIGAPTWCRSLAEMTAQVLAQLRRPDCEPGDMSGTYHMTSSGSVSWHGFAAEILGRSGIAPLPALLPIPSSEYPTPASRPGNSVLSNEKLHRTFGLAAGDWRDNLALCMEELRPR
jgi:dTDP-4-dehydrorhamnose reductase